MFKGNRRVNQFKLLIIEDGMEKVRKKNSICSYLTSEIFSDGMMGPGRLQAWSIGDSPFERWSRTLLRS